MKSSEKAACMSGRDEGVVVPFRVAKAGLWAAQREWLQTSGPLHRLANHVAEQLDGAERDLQAIEAALDQPCWEGR